MSQALLEINDLTTEFPTRRGLVTAVKDVSFKLAPGEILGIVGESGCGKSTILRSIMRLISHPGRISSGEIRFRGQNLLDLNTKNMRKIRGKEIAMIFQDPLSTLNPVFHVGEQIREAMRLHSIVKDGDSALPWPFDRAVRQQERERVIKVMEEVGIPAADVRYSAYPHEFSGGMQQRALIAIGLICSPSLLLADEPTTALDVTIQAQIVNLMQQINRDYGTSIILVTHNLGLAAEFCHNIAVMYAGQIVEHGSVDEVIENPKHPYTQGLLSCLPNVSNREQRILPIQGTVPDLANLPAGCTFAPRCSQALEHCHTKTFELAEVTAEHYARCALYEETIQEGL